MKIYAAAIGFTTVMALAGCQCPEKCPEKSAEKAPAQQSKTVADLKARPIIPNVVVENKFHKLTVEPGAGARVSSWIIKSNNENLVKSWEKIKKMGKRKPTKHQQFSGGACGFHMAGSYLDEQLEAIYEIIKQNDNEIVLRWKNTYPMFSGLVETRSIKLDGDKVVVNVSTENTGKETRILYYRMQDFIGTGHQIGEQTVWIYPGREGIIANIFKRSTVPIMDLHGNWFAQADLVNDYGIKVTAKGAKLRNIMFFTSGPISRTCEFFWAPVTLKPGEKWEATVETSYFKPSAEKNEFSEQNIRTALNRSLDVQGKSEEVDCTFAPAYGNAVVTPLPGGGSIPEGSINERFKTLKTLNAFGTPGEVVLTACSLTAQKNLGEGKISFGKFTTADGKELKAVIDPFFITRNGWDFMTKQWKYADGLPPETCNARSKVKITKNITPFLLKKDETAHFRTYFRIAKDAQPGDYSGKCIFTFADGSKIDFTINLKVFPFSLILNKNKSYGAFNTMNLIGDKHYTAKQGSAVSRTDFRRQLEQYTARNFRNMVLYTTNAENILFALDTLADLGWRDARIVILRPHVSYKKLMERYKKYNFTFLLWGVDEPVDYNSVRTCYRRYNAHVKNHDFPRLNFSANTPLSLAIIDALPKMHPTIAVTGNVMYFVEKTRELAKQNRMSFWYAGYPRRDVAGRLVRGIYVWKEPTGGMMDWGEMANTSSSKNAFHAFFADGEMRPSQRLENLTQGLNDMLYLHTLEEHLKKADPKSPAAVKAKAFLDWIRNRFGIDYVGEAEGMNYAFLDMIRYQAATHTAELLKAK